VSFADPYAMMLAYLAWSLVILGYVDQARSRLEEALTEARARRHGHTLADVLLAASTIESLTGSPQTYADELLALANDRGLPLYLGWATAYRGESLAALGQEQEGVSLISRGLTGIRATGAVTGTPNLLMILAAAYARLGKPADGLNCLSEAAQIIETTEERSSEAEMHRLRGDLLKLAGDRAASERSYHQAIALAKLQSAKLFELRASIRLARLWCERDRRDEARDLLAPIRGWFTEGFDAPDLKQASTLLEQVS
jgi:tetratricopeptide (TPR) repeat protein